MQEVLTTTIEHLIQIETRIQQDSTEIATIAENMDIKKQSAELRHVIKRQTITTATTATTVGPITTTPIE
jgi:hypothetical protein